GPSLPIRLGGQSARASLPARARSSVRSGHALRRRDKPRPATFRISTEPGFVLSETAASLPAWLRVSQLPQRDSRRFPSAVARVRAFLNADFGCRWGIVGGALDESTVRLRGLDPPPGSPRPVHGRRRFGASPLERPKGPQREGQVRPGPDRDPPLAELGAKRREVRLRVEVPR